MRLVDLEPELLLLEMRVDTWKVVRPDGTEGLETGAREHMTRVDRLAEAHGILFLCPKCYAEHPESRGEGVHSVVCWFLERGVPEEALPGPGRWAARGTDFTDLSLVAGRSSIRVSSGCRAHFFVSEGAIVMCE